jgi:hypothetical protein
MFELGIPTNSQDLKEYPSQYSVYAFGEYIHYIDKM